MTSRGQAFAIVCLAGTVSLTCFSSPPLIRVIFPETGVPFNPGPQHESRRKPGETVRKTDPYPATGFSFLRYEGGSRALFFGTTGDFRTEISILQSEDLRSVMETLQPNIDHRTREPDLFPVRVRITNRTDRQLHADLERVEVSRIGGGAIQCMKAEQYTTTFYSRSMFPLLFEWALDQKDDYRNLHPIPDYVLDGREARSGSETEVAEALAASMAAAKRRHGERTIVQPFGSVEGICLFPLLLPGRYELRYARAQEGPARPAPFSPVQFVVRYGTDRDGARSEVGRYEEPETKEADNFVEMHERSRRRRRGRAHAELYLMHRQYHDHDKMRRRHATRSRKTPAKAPSAGGGSKGNPRVP